MVVEAARRAIEKLYKDKCTITARQSVTDEITKKTRFEIVTILENQPCRLSFASISATSEGDVAGVAQSVKLFLPPEIEVMAGSKIDVERQGTVTSYTNSGKPAIYSTHQEINLDLFVRWA